MRMSIYIVDDEKMAIQYFHYLLKNTEMDCEIVGEATNSMTALNEIIHLKPDVIFADINMPVMDGLELSEEILKRVNTKIFLLTSYRDFDYVKKGLSIGVSDYILKNDLTEKSLKEILEKAQKDLMVERKEKHLILEYNVRKFLLSDEGIFQEDHLYEHRTMQRYGLLRLNGKREICIRHYKKEIYEKPDCCKLEEICSEKGLKCSAFVEMENGILCGVFFIQGDVTDGQVLLEKAAERCVKYLAQQGHKWNCLISDTKYHFLELQKEYREMARLSEYLYAYPHRDIFHISELRKDREENIIADTGIETFSVQMEKREPDNAVAALEFLFEQWRQRLTVWEYTEKLQNVYHYLKTFVRKNSICPDVLNIQEEYAGTQEAENALKVCVKSLFENAEEEKRQNCSLYVQAAIGFIYKNYSRDISVPDIAEYVKISEGHLRRLFKQELNMKIVDFLTEYRVERAKILMRDTEESITEIWKKTGFTSAQYFSYVFKRKEGVLPKEYRKNLKNG